MIFLFGEILAAALRTLIAFVLILVITRILGRKAVSQMTPFDFALGITLGTVTGTAAIGERSALHITVTVLIAFGILGLLTDLFHIKSIIFRRLINSEPIVVIQDGQINEANMRKCRLTLGGLNSLLRDKNIFDISEVHCAVMENAGTLSVLPKAEFKPLAPKDMQMKPLEGGLTRDIIVDGVLIKENLFAANLNEAWLLETLKNSGANSVSEVFYAGLASNGVLYISKRTAGKRQSDSVL